VPFFFGRKSNLNPLWKVLPRTLFLNRFLQ